MRNSFFSRGIIWTLAFELLLGMTVFSIPVYVSTQNGINNEYVVSVKSWNEEFWNSLGRMWGVFPTRPTYMMIAKGNFGPEMGFTVSYPDSFRVLVEIRYPLSQTRATVAHELMHVFQFAWIKRYRHLMPLWVMEGLATWYGGKNGTYISPLGDNPFLFWSVDVLKYKSYPKGEESKGEYYSEVYALFNAIDEKVNLEENFPKFVSYAEEGDSWQDALSKMLGENFNDFYSRWRKENLLLVSLKFASFWGIWIGMPLLLLVIFFIRHFKMKDDSTPPDDVEKLEKSYGKEYWKGDDR